MVADADCEYYEHMRIQRVSGACLIAIEKEVKRIADEIGDDGSAVDIRDSLDIILSIVGSRMTAERLSSQ